MCLGPADRAELQALLTGPTGPHELVARAGILLATAKGQGSNDIMRPTGMATPMVPRWRQRHPDVGVPGPKRDKTRPAPVSPLPWHDVPKVTVKTVQATPPRSWCAAVVGRGRRCCLRGGMWQGRR